MGNENSKQSVNGTSQAAGGNAINCISVRDCQTQSISKAVLEFVKQAEENARNHKNDADTALTRAEIEKEWEAFAGDQSQPGPQRDKPSGDPAGKAPPVGLKKVASYAFKATAAAAVIGVGTFVAAPLVLAGLGFTTSGITAGSIGASMMSSAAIANGGGIAAGSTVAVLQSLGAAGGLAASTCAAVGVGSAAVGAALVAVGEVTVGAVRKIKRQKNKPGVEVGTQTDHEGENLGVNLDMLMKKPP